MKDFTPLSSDLWSHINKALLPDGEPGLVQFLVHALIHDAYRKWELKYEHQNKELPTKQEVAQFYEIVTHEKFLAQVTEEAYKILFEFWQAGIEGKLSGLEKESFDRHFKILSDKLDRNSRFFPGFLIGTLTGVAGNAVYSVVQHNASSAFSLLFRTWQHSKTWLGI